MAMRELVEAIESFVWAGPGNTDMWEPGEDVDYDALAADVINAAMVLIEDAQKRT